MKATKPLHCTHLLFPIFGHVLFHNAAAEASTRGYVLTVAPLHPLCFLLLLVVQTERFCNSCNKKSGSLVNGLTFFVGLVATAPVPSWGSPTLQSGGQNEMWATRIVSTFWLQG